MLPPPKSTVEHFDDPDKLCALAVLRRHGLHEEADILQRHFGGMMFYVPKRPSPTDRHVLAIGMEAGQLLSEALGGIRVGIPKGDNARLTVMNAHIALLSLAGLPSWVIALLLGTTDRTVARSRDRWRDQGVIFPVSIRTRFQNTFRKVK